MAYDLFEPKKREDGRWIVVYGKDLPHAGKQCPGTDDYPNEESAMDALNRKQTRRGMFDRFLMEREPEPVEWTGEGEEKEEADEYDGKGMLSMGTVTMPLHQLFMLLGIKHKMPKHEPKEDAESE